FSSGVAQVQPVAWTPIIGGAPGAPARASSIGTSSSAVLPTASVAVMTTPASGGSGYVFEMVPFSSGAACSPSMVTAAMSSAATRTDTVTSWFTGTGSVGERTSIEGGVVSSTNSRAARSDRN